MPPDKQIVFPGVFHEVLKRGLLAYLAIDPDNPMALQAKQMLTPSGRPRTCVGEARMKAAKKAHAEDLKKLRQERR
ncbi:TPA: hypothetical protein DDW35_00485 [Candidatus Sumerlaeota bacterium]|nr:hypothetical protein [Candidatus Sumerlaeota bacterium]